MTPTENQDSFHDPLEALEVILSHFDNRDAWNRNDGITKIT
jgi:hypothetical protein